MSRLESWAVPAQEVGRWECQKCGRICVATGPRSEKFRGTGAFDGPCPWGCGAHIRRGFRFVKPGTVRVWRDGESGGDTSGDASGV
jgi:hypothetical protein